MKFWDTSALVPLVLAEDTSRAMRTLMMSGDQPVVSFITIIEMEAAIARRLRAEPQTREAAAQFLSALQGRWSVIDEYPVIVINARQLATRYGLRSGDAIQLASVLVLCGNGPRIPVITLDDELAAAARSEGFPVLP